MSSPIKLPELPEPRIIYNGEDDLDEEVYDGDQMKEFAKQAVREALAAQRPLFIYDPVSGGVTPVWKWPEEPTPAMIEAMRTGSRKDWPSDELCRVRYAALRSAALASSYPKENNHAEGADQEPT